MRYKKNWFFILLTILVSFLVLNNSGLKQNKFVQSLSKNNQFATREVAKVVRVVDGDTIRVLINSKEDTVRLIGIDAPETMDPRKSVECFGKEASEKAKEILTGKTITLEPDPTQENRDKYGRLLRYVFLNNLNINKLMISEGYAHEYTYQSNPYKYQLEFVETERSARESRKGLWGNVCNLAD